MTRIDLIPPELIAKQKARRIIVVMSLAFGAIFTALVFLYMVLYAQMVVAGGRVTVIRDTKTQVEGTANKLKSYDERKQTLDERQKIVIAIVENQVFWSGVLNNVSMVIPNDVWLTDFTADLAPILAAKTQGTKEGSSTKPAPPITMTGYALDHTAVARWLVHLNEVNQFRSVWLKFAQEQEVEGRTLVQFEVSVQLTKFAEEEETKK